MKNLLSDPSNVLEAGKVQLHKSSSDKEEIDSLSLAYISPSKPVYDYSNTKNNYTIGASLPDFLAPNNKDPIRQWKISHEKTMFDKLITTQQTLREKKHNSKTEVAKMLRKVPFLLLTKDFLNKETMTIDARAYVIDKLIPVVVLGLEKLLMEADKRGLVDVKEMEPNFNPIDYLARFLMRNNPKFSNFNEASPYVRGVRQVVEELRTEIFHLSDNKLAKVKADAKNKREERDKEEERKRQEAQRRIEIYQKLFDQFLIFNHTKVDYETVHVSIKSFSEIVDKLPEEMKEKFEPILKMTQTEEKIMKLGRKDFGLLISHYADHMPLDIFNQFTEHLQKCAHLYTNANQKESRRQLLSNLFMTCDLDEMGMLDRHRVLMLFEQFYQHCPMNIKDILRDPRHWPISDYNTEAKKAEQNRETNEKDANENNSQPVQDFNSSAANVPTYERSEHVDKDTEMTNECDGATKVYEDLVNSEEEVGGKEDQETLAVAGENSVKVDDLKTVEDDEEKDFEVAVEEVEEIQSKDIEPKQLDDLNPTIEEGKSDEVEPVSAEMVEKKVEKRVQIAENVDENFYSDQENTTEPEFGLEAETDAEADDTLEEDLEGPDITREMTKASILTESSAYDEENITFPQFCQVTEEFLGDPPTVTVLEDLIEFIRINYEETPDERLARMKKAHRKVVSAKRKSLIDELFNVWDVENSGSVSMTDIAQIMKQYRSGSLDDGIKTAKKEARVRLTRQVKNVYLNRKEFRAFIYTVAQTCMLLDEEEEMESMLQYFVGLVQRTFVEKMRAEARRKWLNNIVWASETCNGKMESIYRAVFQAIYKDVEHHGEAKKISVSIGLLERNSVELEVRGKYLIHFVAATGDQTDYVVGRVLDKANPGISFHVVYSGNMVHVPHASDNPNVIFWNEDLEATAKEGSVVAVPIKDDLQRVFGVLVVDSVNDPTPEKASFSPHETAFIQGISKQFSIAFHQAEMQRKLIKTSGSAISWICRRIPSIRGATLLLRERRDMRATVEFVLRQVLSSDEHGTLNSPEKAPRLLQEDNLFKKYLFEAVDTSQTFTADAYGNRHIAIPLRDLGGLAVAAVDISIGELRLLPQLDNMEVVRLMSLLQRAYNEVIQLGHSTDPVDSDSDPALSGALVIPARDSSDAELVFDRLILADLRANIARMDAQSYAEIKSYKDPPAIVHVIIESLLSLLHPAEALTGLFHNWDKCKRFINPGLSKLILAFDPFGDVSSIPLQMLIESMDRIPHSEIDKHGSKPAKDLFNWVFCCVSLIRHRIVPDHHPGPQ